MSIGPKCFITMLVLLAGPGHLLVEGASYEVRAWREVSIRDWSPLGRAVMRGGGRSWTHAESRRFFFHAAQGDALPALVAEVEWCYDEVCRQLGLPPLEQAGRLFVLDSAADWSRVMRSAGRMEEGVAMHVGSEIYLLRDSSHSVSYVDVPHELVHFRLWQAYGHALPLWLEEGLAVEIGWSVATAYQLTRQLRLYREQPPLEPDALIPWAAVFAAETYPTVLTDLQAFYRQSAALVAILRTKIPENEWPLFMASMNNRERSLESILIIDYEWKESELNELLNLLNQQLSSPRYTTYGR